eukprot:PhM_4_TR3037/c0_g2_i3/m.93705
MKELFQILHRLKRQLPQNCEAIDLIDEENVGNWFVRLRLGDDNKDEDNKNTEYLIVSLRITFDLDALEKFPMCFVIQPRLRAGFIHHGAICSQELGATAWALSEENVRQLIATLVFTLDPTLRGGVVFYDPSDPPYSSSEHEVGTRHLKTVHPTFFRRSTAAAASPSVGPITRGHEENGDGADDDRVHVIAFDIASLEEWEKVLRDHTDIQGPNNTTAPKARSLQVTFTSSFMCPQAIELNGDVVSSVSLSGACVRFERDIKLVNGVNFRVATSQTFAGNVLVRGSTTSCVFSNVNCLSGFDVFGASSVIVEESNFVRLRVAEGSMARFRNCAVRISPIFILASSPPSLAITSAIELCDPSTSVEITNCTFETADAAQQEMSAVRRFETPFVPVHNVIFASNGASVELTDCTGVNIVAMTSFFTASHTAGITLTNVKVDMSPLVSVNAFAFNADSTVAELNHVRATSQWVAHSNIGAPIYRTCFIEATAGAKVFARTTSCRGGFQVGVRVVDSVFHNTVGSSQWSSMEAGLMMHGGSVVLENVVIDGSVIGVGLQHHARAQLADCNITSHKTCVEVTDNALFSCTRSNLHCAMVGVFVENAGADLTKTTIDVIKGHSHRSENGNHTRGIFAQFNAHLFATNGCEIRNTSVGVCVMHDSVFEAEDITLRNIIHAAFRVSESKATLTRGECTSEHVGAEFCNHSTITISDFRFTSNLNCIMLDASSCTMVNSHVTSTKETALVASSGSPLHITRSRLTTSTPIGGPKEGMAVHIKHPGDGAAVLFESCIFDRASLGVYIEGTAPLSSPRSQSKSGIQFMECRFYDLMHGIWCSNVRGVVVTQKTTFARCHECCLVLRAGSEVKVTSGCVLSTSRWIAEVSDVGSVLDMPTGGDGVSGSNECVLLDYPNNKNVEGHPNPEAIVYRNGGRRKQLQAVSKHAQCMIMIGVVTLLFFVVLAFYGAML